MTLLNGEPIEPVGGPTTPVGPPTASSDSQTVGTIAGFIAIISAIVFAPAGIVIGAIALRQAKLGGYRNPLAQAGFIIGIVICVLTVLILLAVFVFAVPFFVDLFSGLVQFCAEHGNGIFIEDGVRYECNV